MLNKAEGNMYSWVTHTWSVLNGACAHDCDYCYVKTSTVMRNPKTRSKYEGTPRISEKDKGINLGEGKKIFVAHTGDLFAENVPDEVIRQVLQICRNFPMNNYVFQTKNPKRVIDYMGFLPRFVELGTTIESDDGYLVSQHSKAPPVVDRMEAITALKKCGYQTFITIEPIMRFTTGFASRIAECNPDFVNIGADSKKHDLPEPTAVELDSFVKELQERGVQIRIKENLERIRGEVA